MSVPSPELLKMLAAQKGGAPGGMPGGAPGPMGSPMAKPQIPAGQRESAMATIGTCLDQMELTLPKLGAETEEGQAVMKALQSLAKVFGDHRAQMKELAPAQLMQLMHGMPGGPPTAPHSPLPAPPGAPPLPGGAPGAPPLPPGVPHG